MPPPRTDGSPLIASAATARCGSGAASSKGGSRRARRARRVRLRAVRHRNGGTVARQSEYPGVYPYPGSDGERLYYCRYPRSDGTWTTKRGFRSERAANSFRTTAIYDAKRGDVASTPRDSFAVLFDRWFARRRPYLSEGTIRDYEVHGRKRLKASLGAMRLSRVTVDDIEELVDDML